MHSVLIVEDDPMASNFFDQYVRGSSDFTVAGTLSSAAIAEAWCLGHDVDLVLMDVCTAGQASGLDAAAKIKRSCPAVKVLIVTSQPEVDFIARAKNAHVESFWYKTTGEAELLHVMRETMEGKSIYPSASPDVCFGEVHSSDLTPLEVRILRELTTGVTNMEIAERLHLSPRTVGNNVQSMLNKTGFKTRTMLACAAVDSGIVINGI
ncbi:response regulator transcription factor [Curtanaerobium respiraculi]|uniref:response regulator transcription factor n=1 Tax=Curtanaerobium respiraculi TaxID=2949669 RepID=UPI0024B35163|nr:response regulator transcription factor [Curtanaerobium respiraculi]